MSFEAVSYADESGHIFNPGDRVIALTTSTRRPSVFTGTYLGLNKKRVVLEADKKTKVFRNAKGEDYDFAHERTRLLEADAYPYKYHWGSSEYDAAARRSELLKEEWQKGYTWIPVQTKRRTVLRNNRIRPILAGVVVNIP